MRTTLPPGEAEWLAPDGLGGFAGGTVSGVRTRRYHGLLVPATMPPAGRTVLVNGFEESRTLSLRTHHEAAHSRPGQWENISACWGC
jgi:glycogen debranching enzyme